MIAVWDIPLSCCSVARPDIFVFAGWCQKVRPRWALACNILMKPAMACEHGEEFSGSWLMGEACQSLIQLSHADLNMTDLWKRSLIPGDIWSFCFFIKNVVWRVKISQKTPRLGLSFFFILFRCSYTICFYFHCFTICLWNATSEQTIIYRE